ncbi:MAG: nicotinate-nucleotide--dimethylbenzimidazole phosphoribosyltransferase [Deltaproteobacteria bacterium]|nr:nicotinate-nucleotide--dimethylbenzimidazole phosphoribosyltransferase [Deltaproteobacteria bacterium]
MKDLRKIIDGVNPLSEDCIRRAQDKLDNLTKPVGSLGRLEKIARQYSAIKEDLNPSIKRKLIVTFAGDHGVVARGVSAYPKEVTVQMVLNMLAGGAAVNVLARHVGAEVIVVDIGVDHDFEPRSALLIRKVGYGTRDFTGGPAMSRDEALKSINVGIDLAAHYAEKGVDIIGTGEMGIGNTTPSSAILSVMTGIAPQEITGMGTGIDNRTLRNKIDSIERAIDVNSPKHSDPVDVLAKVGGYEIGGIAGLIIGGAAHHIPIVVDGFISTAGALIAVALNPAINDYLFYSHLSAERGHKKMFERLAREPIMNLDMRLGEGTGAAVAISLIEASVNVMNEMATFESAGVDRNIEQ